MHLTQQKLLQELDEKPFIELTLRDIGKKIGEKYPQAVKHHLTQLNKNGFIVIDKENKTIKKVSKADSDGFFISLPILGSANCGPANICAEADISGFLKVSKGILNKNGNFFVIKADGDSMNKSNINGNNIENGDYVVIDKGNTSVNNGDYILSIIDNMANIKKYFIDKENNQIILMSESTQDYPPIYISENDNFIVNGKVIQIIKKPKF
jgi:repressor LexA